MANLATVSALFLRDWGFGKPFSQLAGDTEG